VRVDPGNGLQRESESGKWFIQDRSYKLKIEKVQDRAASAWHTSTYQTYAVGEVQTDSIKLTHSLTGQQLTEKRVAADYKLP